MEQAALFYSKQTWMHFIGKQYYASTKKFVAEAQSLGISRRVPVQTARGMNFGDRVILLRWSGAGKVEAFAEMEINGLVLEHEIADRICSELKAQGKAEYTEAADGGCITQRECGFYISLGTWRVDAEISEIMESAVKIAEQENRDIFVMIGGKLTQIYDKPILLSPAPRFTRGFIRANPLTTFQPDAISAERQVVSIKDYRKNERKGKRAVDSRLPLPAFTGGAN